MYSHLPNVIFPRHNHAISGLITVSYIHWEHLSYPYCFFNNHKLKPLYPVSEDWSSKTEIFILKIFVFKQSGAETIADILTHNKFVWITLYRMVSWPQGQTLPLHWQTSLKHIWLTRIITAGTWLKKRESEREKERERERERRNKPYKVERIGSINAPE